SRVAAELGPGARAVAGLPSEAVPPKAAPRSPTELRDADAKRRVLSLRLEIGERVAVDAELSQGVRRFWDRFRASAPGVLAAAHTSRPLDAEIRSFFPPVPLVVQHIDKLSPADEPSVALACGDLDGDGSIELVSVGRARIKVGRFKAGHYVVEKQAAWAQLSGVAAHPLRDPIASAQILEGHGLRVGLSDRAEGLQLDEHLGVSGRFPNRAPWPPEACTQRSGLGFLTTPQDCRPERASTGKGSLGSRKEKLVEPTSDAEPTAAIDSFAGLRLIRADGTQFVIRARRDLSGRVALQVNERELESRWPAGASLALGDLDGDGRAELLSSENTLDATQDALSVRTLTAVNDLEPVLRLPVASGINAIAVCPAAPLNFAPVVLATGDGFWVLR
ncbi:MAG TPA: hypothetical protein VFQ61_36605, partial [Polyangiaceae bacterium]|nr:hypothetical protein [Polyangiaceae bacterium]